MRSPQELREVILELLDGQGGNTHQMLKKCGYNASLVNDLKKGQMPSADKIANIANYLGVSTDFLLGSEKSVISERDSDADLIDELRKAFYGSSAIKFTPEDKQKILDMAKMLIQFKSAPEQKRERAD